MLPDGTRDERRGARTAAREARSRSGSTCRLSNAAGRRGTSSMACSNATRATRASSRTESVSRLCAGADDADADRHGAAGRRAPGLRAGHRGSQRRLSAAARVDQDFVTHRRVPDARGSYQDVKDIRGPMVVKTTSLGVTDADDTPRPRTARQRPTTRPSAAHRSTRRRSSPRNPRRSTRQPARRRLPRPRATRTSASSRWTSCVEYLHRRRQEGRRHQPLQGPRRDEPRARLWETTMDPATRTLRRSARKTTWKPT